MTLLLLGKTITTKNSHPNIGKRLYESQMGLTQTPPRVMIPPAHPCFSRPILPLFLILSIDCFSFYMFSLPLSVWGAGKGTGLPLKPGIQGPLTNQAMRPSTSTDTQQPLRGTRPNHMAGGKPLPGSWQMPDWTSLSTGMGAPGQARQADGETETDRLNSSVLSNTHFLPCYKTQLAQRWTLNWI